MNTGPGVGMILIGLTLFAHEALLADTVVLRGGRVLLNVTTEMHGNRLIVTTAGGRRYSFKMDSVRSIKVGERTEERRGIRRVPNARARARRSTAKKKGKNRTKGSRERPSPSEPTIKPAPNLFPLITLRRDLAAPPDHPNAPAHPAWSIVPFFSPLLIGNQKTYGFLMTIGKIVAAYQVYLYSTAVSVAERSQDSGSVVTNFLLLSAAGQNPVFLNQALEFQNGFQDPDAPARRISPDTLKRKRQGAMILLVGLMALDFHLARNARLNMCVNYEGHLGGDNKVFRVIARFNLDADVGP